jgi:hypothetical protein
MIAGKDISVSEILRLTKKTSVHQFNGKQAGEATLSKWVDQFWKHVLGYLLELILYIEDGNLFMLWSERGL